MKNGSLGLNRHTYTYARSAWRRGANAPPAGPESISAALTCWILALAIIVRKTVLVRQRWGEGAFARIDEYVLLEIALIAAGFVLLLCQPVVWTDVWRQRWSSLSWFLAFYVFGMLTALWSVHLPYSGFIAGEAVVQILLVVLAMHYARSFEQAESWMLNVAAMTVMLGICLNFRYHGFSLEWRHWHTNAYTATAALLTCYCMAEYFRASRQRASRLLVYGVLGAGALLLGSSSASCISIPFGMCATAIMIKRTRWPLLFLLGLAVVLAALNPEVLLDLLFPGKSVEQVLSLRGRLFLWSQLTPYISDNLLLGHGFAMGAKLGGMLQTNTHNSLLSVILGTGVVGLVFVVCGLWRFIWELRLAARLSAPGSAGCAAAITAGLVNSMAIGFFGESWRGATLVFTCLLVFHIWILERSVAAFRRRVALSRHALRGPTARHRRWATRRPLQRGSLN